MRADHWLSCDLKCARVFLPHLAKLAIDELERVDGAVVIRAHARGSTVRCPGCGRRTKRIHSRYERTLADTAVGGQPVAIHLRVRRFVCVRSSCPRRTFVEQVDGLTLRYGRHTVLLRRLLEAIGLALAGRAGARMTTRLATPVSLTTLQRLVRALPEHVPKQIPEVGIDDFAFRRGHVHGTIVIDMATHHPVDVLPDRTSETVQAWLKAHQGVQIVCRDRAGAYTEAVRHAPRTRRRSLTDGTCGTT